MKRGVKTGAEMKIRRTETEVLENQSSNLIPVQNQIDATTKGQEKEVKNIACLGIL